MKSAAYWVKHLDLKPHPEGGFYRETYRSADYISSDCLPGGFEGRRSVSTAIYFLLRSEDKSLFHRIKSDEMWHFYAGSSLTIYMLREDGPEQIVLGSSLEQGQRIQLVVPANCWFGAVVNEADSYVLAGCTVAPGFDFEDFEMGTRDFLKARFHHHDVIELLTNADV